MLDEEIERQALFEGLVYNEAGERTKTAFIGGVAHYAIPDDGFMRHVEARKVDDAVLAQLKEQITSQQEDLVRGMLQMLGKDDIFTKAALDASIRNIDTQVRQSDRSQWGPWLQLLGFQGSGGRTRQRCAARSTHNSRLARAMTTNSRAHRPTRMLNNLIRLVTLSKATRVPSPRVFSQEN